MLKMQKNNNKKQQKHDATVKNVCLMQTKNLKNNADGMHRTEHGSNCF